ncbi:AraC family transcriptional regulator [Cellulomonas soli]|uniref:Transcriptional regulator n=1 Tax=Cellulomonas soli TaxID=931535 RepID=A0A512P861_9CELL|nr:AraC family transcriptional regulator [Cellulomonas soli]NYI57610.1 AraC-like DNA-binding protein [Cellulomonas soli]GEP67387.1 transcriptional regulator [Cellulomonas soli]
MTARPTPPHPGTPASDDGARRSLGKAAVPTEATEATGPIEPTWPEAGALLRALSPALLGLVDDLTATMFCAKDTTGRYVAVNEAFVRRTSERSRRDVLGRRAQDLFVPQLAHRYDEQDAAVLATGRPLHRQLELILRPGGLPGWYLTSKVAVQDGAGRTVGLVSMSEDLGTHDPADPAVQSLARVLALVQERLADPPTSAELAAAADCSSSALDRRVRRVFGLSPQQLVLRARIDHATVLLAGDTSVADVAVACGFYDQAALTRTFGRLTGQTPAQFRRWTRGGARP